MGNISVWFSPPGDCHQLVCLPLGATTPSQHLLRRVYPAHLRIHHSAGTYTLLLMLSWQNILSKIVVLFDISLLAVRKRLQR